MGRYSFFISNSFLGGYSVSSASELDYHLSRGSEQYLAIDSDISSNDQDSLSSDTVDNEPTEIQNSENVETDPEEISDENGVTETETPFSSEGDPLEVLVPRLTRDNSGWYKDRKWGFQNVYYINGGFSAWNLNPVNAADNVNNLMFAIRDVVQTLQTQVNSLSSENARAHRRIDSLSNIFSSLTSENDRAHRRIDSLSNITTTLTSENARAHRRIDSLSNITTTLTSENARAHRRIDSLGNITTALSGSLNTVKDNADRANRRIDSLGDTVSALSGAINTVKDNADRANRRIDSLGDTVSSLSGAINDVKDNADRANRRIDSLGDTVSSLSGAINTVKDNADRANRRIDSLGDTVSSLSGAINTVKDNADRANRRLDSFSVSVDNRFEELEGKIGNSSWSDVGIIAGLGLIKDSVDSFKTAFTDLFSVDDLVGLSAHEGKFTRMIKSQFIALRNDLRDLFKTYFGVEMDGEIPTPTGLFSKLLDDLIYKVRYTTIQEFSELKDFLTIGLADILGVQNVTNGWIELIHGLLKESLLAIRQNQISLADWLKLIYEKPVGNVIAPPFDFNRLEEILKSLSFGEITNEAGTNFWDFMKSLIDNLGDIIGKALDGLVDIASKILDFLDGLIDKLLALIIPDNWDFLDKGFGDISKEFDLKFKLFLDLGGKIKDIFTPTQKDFFSTVSWSYLGVTFDGREAKPIMDQFVPKFRTLAQVSIWLMVAWWVYRKVTGSGDLINDN